MEISFSSYAEGDWTPVIEGTSAAGVGTYNPQSGKYVKIGRLVHVNMVLAWSAHTGTGNMIISGLPYATAGAAGVPSFQEASLTTPASSVMQGRASGSTIVLESKPVAGGSATALAIDTAATIRMCMTYMSA